MWSESILTWKWIHNMFSPQNKTSLRGSSFIFLFVLCRKILSSRLPAYPWTNRLRNLFSGLYRFRSHEGNPKASSKNYVEYNLTNEYIIIPV